MLFRIDLVVEELATNVVLYAYPDKPGDMEIRCDVVDGSILCVEIRDVIYTFSQGGPGIASETLYLYSYQVGFGFFKAGYSSALMVVVFMIVLVFNVAMNRMRLSARER